jgi:hypothetical protein
MSCCYRSFSVLWTGDVGSPRGGMVFFLMLFAGSTVVSSLFVFEVGIVSVGGF